MTVLEIIDENAVFLRAIEGLPVLLAMALVLYLYAVFRQEKVSSFR